MFDPDKWIMDDFNDTSLVGVGLRRIVTMIVPLQQMLALVGLTITNGDTAAIDYQLNWQPDAMTQFARVVRRNINAGAGRLLLPEQPISSVDPKFSGPLFFSGPGTLQVEQRDVTTNPAGAVQEIDLHWVQAKFGAKSSDVIVPTGASL